MILANRKCKCAPIKQVKTMIETEPETREMTWSGTICIYGLYEFFIAIDVVAVVVVAVVTENSCRFRLLKKKHRKTLN